MSSDNDYREDVPKTLADEATINEVLRNKTGVMVAIPNLGSKVSTPLTLWINALAFLTIDVNCKYFFKVYLPNDLYPHEWARNQCVRAFMSDPYFKRLWFVDADMVPPGNFLDLLDFDEPIVSGMTYIWSSEHEDDDGHYVPPRVKISAFNYRKDHDDFMSVIPPTDGRSFYADASGGACFVIRRDVLEKMPEPWFRTIRDPYGKALRGEDLDFGLRCREKGIRTLIVPKVRFGHIKQVDLKQVTDYCIASIRDVADGLRKKDYPDVETFKKALPRIKFPGEKQEEVVAPVSLKAVEGGVK